MKRIGPLAALALLSVTGCSIGKITDGTNGGAIGHATVTFESWDTSKRLEYMNGGLIPPAYAPAFAPNASSTTWASTDPGANGRAGIWYLNPYATLAPGDNTNTFVNPGWNRIQISRPGYTTRWVYRDHEYTNWGASVYTTSPYSDGPYAATTSATAADSNTAWTQESFSLYPESQTTRHRQPDVIVDPRTLLDCEISDVAGAPPSDGLSVPVHDCEGAVNATTGQPVTRCLRYSVGTPNVGEGDLWVKSLDGGQTVTQYVYTQPYPSLTADAVAVPGGQILYHPEHNHFHFKDWTVTRLRAATAACQGNPKNCPLVQAAGAKTSFCLEDYRYNPSDPAGSTFDSTYQARRYQPDTCGLEQGIGAGRMDTYRRVLPEQMIDISGLAPGDYWLEVEVDAAHFIEESDYSNNVSRVLVTIPPVGSSPTSWQCYGCQQVGSTWSCTNKEGTVTL